MKRKIVTAVVGTLTALGAIVPTAGTAGATAPRMVVLGTFADAGSCNGAAADNNQVGAELGLPGQFGCLLWRGTFYAVYFDDV